MSRIDVHVLSLFEGHRSLARSMAVSFAKKYRYEHEFDDFHQVALFALFQAALRFSGDRGVLFRIYARSVMAGELLHYVRDALPLMKRPRWLSYMSHTTLSYRVDICCTLEMADFVSALDTSIDERIALHQALADLDDQERFLVLAVTVHGYHQNEVGRRLGIPQRRASRLHARAVKKLARSLQ